MLTRIAVLSFIMGTAHTAVDSPSTTSPTEPLHYEAAFFSQFAPRTALDMLQRLPSFTLRTVDPERRGFAGAVGNVLIDGEQPSAKSQSLEDILQRIPAAQVVRIEVWRGAQAAGTASGESVLANVVRTPSAGAGAWSAGFEYANQHQPAPNGYMSWAGRIGRIEYGLGARGYSLERKLPATRRVSNGDGELVEVRKERSPREFDEHAIDGEVRRNLFGGTLRATGQMYRSDYSQANTLGSLSTQGAWLGDESVPYSESKRTTELGLSLQIPWGAANAEITAVHTGDKFTARSSSDKRTAVGFGQSSYSQVRETEETILRGTIERNFAGNQRVQIGSEVAFNTLDADSNTRGFWDGVEYPIHVPHAQMQVEERRAEPFVTHVWRVGAWASEARLAAEYSTLDFTGDAHQSVDLTYVKPSLQLSRTFGREHQMRMRVAREVGQLDFADFASTVSLSDDVIDGGNPDLRPQAAWRMELAVDLRFDSRSSFAARLYHDWIDDAVDLVPLDGGNIAAAGNIGRGSLDGLQLSFAVPIQRLLPGGSLKLDSTFQRVTVTDPLTRRERPMSDFERNRIKAELRQDTGVQGFAWGVKYSYESSQTDYRIVETDRKRKSPSLDIYLERNFFGGTKATLSVLSVQGSPELRTRKLYEPNRAGALASIEETRAYPGRWITLTLDGKF